MSSAHVIEHHGRFISILQLEWQDRSHNLIHINPVLLIDTNIWSITCDQFILLWRLCIKIYNYVIWMCISDLSGMNKSSLPFPIVYSNYLGSVCLFNFLEFDLESLPPVLRRDVPLFPVGWTCPELRNTLLWGNCFTGILTVWMQLTLCVCVCVCVQEEMAGRRVECLWKRHVVEQLKQRDRVQRQAFEEIIHQCKIHERLFNYSLFFVFLN